MAVLYPLIAAAGAVADRPLALAAVDAGLIGHSQCFAAPPAK